MTTQTTTSQQQPRLDQVEIFRPGKHRATSGAVIEFSAADVADIAACYDPALHEAPHVVGHPATDAPAYGWVRGLAVNDAGRLMVTESRQVNASFADQLASGAYKKRSASFFPPNHPNSPTPGRWYLKHVGWLGAAPPAIKGLADPSFSDAGADNQVVTFGDWDDELNAGLWRRMREWFIGQFGADTADRVIPAYEVDALQREAMRPEPDEATATASTTPAYADTTAGAPVPTTATTTGQAALDARAADLDAREARLREQGGEQARLARSARTAGIAAFADGLITQGRLLPGERARVTAVLEALPDDVRVEFAEGDGQQQLGALEAFQGFLRALPPRVEFAELAARERTAGSGLDVSDSAAIARAAQEFADAEAKAGRTVSIAEAVGHVVTQAGKAD